MRHDITLLAQRRHHTYIPSKRLHQRRLHHLHLSPQGLYQLLRHCRNPRTRIHENFTSAAADAPGTARRPAKRCVNASKCGSVSTVSTLVSPDPSGCKTETRTYEIVLESPSHRCDAGAGICTGTVEDWCGIMQPSSVGIMVLHRLGEPGIYWCHLLRWHANVHTRNRHHSA